MNKNSVLIISGIVLFAIGVSIVGYEIYGDSEFQMNVEETLMIVFYVMVPGMVISGIGVMLEFARGKWG